MPAWLSLSIFTRQCIEIKEITDFTVTVIVLNMVNYNAYSDLQVVDGRGQGSGAGQ